MPLYQIHHTLPLAPTQKALLAQQITKAHSTKFTTPELFVQVTFTLTSETVNDTYIAGRHREVGNRVRAQVRSGPSRTQAEWDDLCLELKGIWDGVVSSSAAANGEKVANGNRNSNGNGHVSAEEEKKLHSIIITGGLIAGWEAGFVLPSAGGDVEWLRSNFEKMKRLAQAGDEDMRALVKDVERRGLLDAKSSGKGIDLKSAAQKLEEMLGWGEAA